MKKTDFKSELDKRLRENKLLSERPGLGKSAEGVSSFVGLNFFWVLVIASFVVAFFWVRNISLESVGNNFLFGFLY